MLAIQSLTSTIRGSCGQALRQAADAFSEPPHSQEMSYTDAQQTGPAYGISQSVESHGKSLVSMGQEHHFGLVAHAHAMESAGQAFGSGIANLGQNINRGVDVHGRSLVELGCSQHLGLLAHGQGIATAGESLTHGMTVAGQDFSQGISALGHGFADMGWYISKSIMLLTLAVVVRAAVDLGFVYIIGALCMTTIAAFFSWNLRLHARLVQQRHQEQSVQRETGMANNALQNVTRLEADLADSRQVFSSMQAQHAEVKAELAQVSSKHLSTVSELEETRTLLQKMSSELCQMQSTGGTGEGARCHPIDGALSFLLTEKDAEVKEAHQEIERVKEELSDALAMIASLSNVRVEGSKRRRSRV